MSEENWGVGRICGRDDEVNLEKSALVAEVHSRALRADDGGLVATYFLVHDLSSEEAEKAMMFFSAQPSLIVDTMRLVEDAGAEYPALVTIRYTDETAAYLATACDYDFLRMLPADDVINRSGWDLHCAIEALERGEKLSLSDGLPDFDYRSLRRKIFALRASVGEDRDPWLEMEHERLRTLTKDVPEGVESIVARADDMEAALTGAIDVGHGFAVVIPTVVERGQSDGPVFEWVPQVGREIVVAHGLDAIQAAIVLKNVRDNPDDFVAKGELLSGPKVRESARDPMVVPDMALNWISTDFTGRRNQRGYARLQQKTRPASEVSSVQMSPAPDVLEAVSGRPISMGR